MDAERHLANAFTGTPFQGNTAPVCILKEPAEPVWMLQIAAEMKHSESHLSP